MALKRATTNVVTHTVSADTCGSATLKRGQRVLVTDGYACAETRVRRILRKRFETLQGHRNYADEGRTWARGWNTPAADALRAAVALTRDYGLRPGVTNPTGPQG